MSQIRLLSLLFALSVTPSLLAQERIREPLDLQQNRHTQMQFEKELQALGLTDESPRFTHMQLKVGNNREVAKTDATLKKEVFAMEDVPDHVAITFLSEILIDPQSVIERYEGDFCLINLHRKPSRRQRNNIWKTKISVKKEQMLLSF